MAMVDEPVILQALARVSPSWELIQRLHSGGAFWRDNLQVLFTVQRYGDGKIWLHVSACGRTGPNSWFLPNWDQLKQVKSDFIGVDSWAYQVFPPSKDYINHHEYVLHLFAPMDGVPALPDFTWGLRSI
jgi:hypothetical protein